MDSEKATPSKPSIYLIGDSISIDYHPYLKALANGHYTYSRKSGLELARKDLNIPTGANGGDSKRVLVYLRELITEGELVAQAVLVNCGLHDIKTDPETGQRQVSMEDYRANLIAILSLLNGARKRPIWITTTPVNEDRNLHDSPGFYRFEKDVAAYNLIAGEVMSAHGVSVIDLHAVTASMGPQFFRDHAHFAEAMSRIQAACIHGWLMRDFC